MERGQQPKFLAVVFPSGEALPGLTSTLIFFSPLSVRKHFGYTNIIFPCIRSIKRRKFDDELVESSLVKSSSRVKGPPVIEPVRCSGSDPSSTEKKKVRGTEQCEDYSDHLNQKIPSF